MTTQARPDTYGESTRTSSVETAGEEPNGVETAGEEPNPTIRGSLKSFGAIFAPATLVGGLLLYVGWVRTGEYFRYFGISPDQLGFSPQDYVLRSGDVAVGAVVLTALAGGVLLVLDRIVMNLLRRWSGRRERLIRGCTAFAGCALVLVGLLDVTRYARLANTPPLGSAGLVAAGAVLLLRFGAGSPGRKALLGPGTVVFGLAVIALTSFWAADSYAYDIGQSAARDIDANSSQLPVVVIMSNEPIDIPGSLVVAKRFSSGEGKWFYRYTGARLLAYANGRWFLIVAPPQKGYRSMIFILQDVDSLHVETATPVIARR